MIPIQDIDHAYDRMRRSDVKYRFVIDNATLADDTAHRTGIRRHDR